MKLITLHICSGDMEISDVIEFNVKRCREALFKAAGISGGAILNSW